MKKFKVFNLIILIFIFIIISYILLEFPIQKKIAEESLYKYLEINKILKDEIYNIKVFREIKTNNYKYNILVKFKREMNLTYKFSYNLSNSRLTIEEIYFSTNNKILGGGESLSLHKNITPLFIKNYSNQSKLILKYNITNYIKDLIK